MQKALNTDTGTMNVDGDYEDATDAINTVGMTDATVVTAKLLLTLEATTGSIVPAGTLTLKAGNGLIILNDMTGAATAK